MKYIAIIALLFLTACSVTQPHIVEYKINPNLSEKSFDAMGCKKRSIKITHAFSSDALMVKKMKYMSEGFEEYAFNESEWSQSPSRAITAEIVRSVRASSLFKSVQSHKSRSKSDYALESTIEEFSQYFNKAENHSYVNVTISMTLIDTKTSQVIDSMKFSKELESDTLDAKGGVRALNLALSQTLLQSNTWLNEVCK